MSEYAQAKATFDAMVGRFGRNVAEMSWTAIPKPIAVQDELTELADEMIDLIGADPKARQAWMAVCLNHRRRCGDPGNVARGLLEVLDARDPGTGSI